MTGQSGKTWPTSISKTAEWRAGKETEMNLGELQRIRKIVTDDEDHRTSYVPQPVEGDGTDSCDGARWPQGVTPPW